MPTLKELYDAIKNIPMTSKEYIGKVLASKLAKLSPKTLDIYFANIENSKIENKDIQEEGVKDFFKKAIGEIFPSLSFYPALVVWGIVDKMIKQNIGFSRLSNDDKRCLVIYSALFFGMVGAKLGITSLKEYIKKRQEMKKDSE